MEGRPIIREATLTHYKAEPTFANEETPLFSLWTEHEYKKSPQWGMVIDLNSCTGCNACAVACQSENNIPVVGKDQVRRGREMAWLRIDRYFTGEPSDPGAAFQPVPCMQCENAPCEQVCPVAATVHDAEGLNAMVYNRCIGTRYCSNNCPYKVRRFNFFNYTKDTPEVLKLAQQPGRDRALARRDGEVHLLRAAAYRGEDRRAPRRARAQGRRRQDRLPAGLPRGGDPVRRPAQLESRVAKARANDRTYALLADLNTRPRTTYQARLRNPHPALREGRACGGAAEEKGHA